jgi:hypothetical protein
MVAEADKVSNGNALKMPALKFDKFASGMKNALLAEKKETDEKLKRE